MGYEKLGPDFLSVAKVTWKKIKLKHFVVLGQDTNLLLQNNQDISRKFFCNF